MRGRKFLNKRNFLLLDYFRKRQAVPPIYFSIEPPGRSSAAEDVEERRQRLHRVAQTPDRCVQAVDVDGIDLLHRLLGSLDRPFNIAHQRLEVRGGEFGRDLFQIPQRDHRGRVEIVDLCADQDRGADGDDQDRYGTDCRDP